MMTAKIANFDVFRGALVTVLSEGRDGGWKG